MYTLMAGCGSSVDANMTRKIVTYIRVFEGNKEKSHRFSKELKSVCRIFVLC